MKHRILTLVLATAVLAPAPALAQAQATTLLESAALQQTTADTAAGRRSARSLDGPVLLGEDILMPAEHPRRWTVVPSFSWSFFNKGRDSWQEEDVQIFFQPYKTLLLGAEIDLMQRPPAGNDIMYSAMASWYPWKYLELHSKLSFTPNPKFSPDQIYEGGFEYMVHPRALLLFDFQQLNFSSQGSLRDNSISQIKPGLSVWLTEKSFITLRYARGWAFNSLDYNYYSGTLNIGDLPGNGRLTLGFAYGTDPDLDFGTDQTSLSNAYVYTLFYTHPLTDYLSVFGGVEYVYRLKQDSNEELYQQLTPTIGLAWKF